MAYQQKQNKKQSVSAATKPRSAEEQRAEEQRAEELLRRAQEKQKRRDERQAPTRVSGKGPKAFVKGTIRELKLTTWPRPAELLRWCLIVIATVALFAIGSMLIDNFIATPLMYWISSLDFGSQEFGPLDIALVVVLFLSGIGSIVGVYMHQGGETEGLSDTMASRLTGGSGQAQKNLDRITLVCIIVFVVCLIACMIVYPQGTIAS